MKIHVLDSSVANLIAGADAGIAPCMWAAPAL